MTDFVEVKTADLVGPALDWAVAKAEISPMEMPPKDRVWSKYCATYSPSTDWSQGGPLIEKHQVCTGWAGDKPLAFTRNAKYSDNVTVAPTLLIAACRTIVASVLGETVSVPKELLS